MERHLTTLRCRVTHIGPRWWWHCMLCLNDGELTDYPDAKAAGQVHEQFPDGVPELTPEMLDLWRRNQ